MENRDIRTTSDGVRSTYYDIPMIKPPHWRWLVLVYFFTGALAGGCSTIAALADLVGADRGVVRAGRYLALAAVIPSPVLLALDLGRPERAFHMFRVVKLRSPMSLGSWALLVVGLITGPLGVLQILTDVLKRPVLPSLQRVLNVAELPFSLFLSGYTGLLLGITNVPLWARGSLLLGPTFVSSAFSGSFAAIGLVLRFAGEQPSTARKLARAETFCLSAELLLLIAGLLRLGRFSRHLIRPPWGLLFWPFTVVGGVIAPLLLQIAGPARGRPVGNGRRAATAILVLIGGFVLRMTMLFAGKASARDPEEYQALTAMPGGFQLPNLEERPQ